MRRRSAVEALVRLQDSWLLLSLLLLLRRRWLRRRGLLPLPALTSRLHLADHAVEPLPCPSAFTRPRRRSRLQRRLLLLLLLLLLWTLGAAGSSRRGIRSCGSCGSKEGVVLLECRDLVPERRDLFCLLPHDGPRGRELRLELQLPLPRRPELPLHARQGLPLGRCVELRVGRLCSRPRCCWGLGLLLLLLFVASAVRCG